MNDRFNWKKAWLLSLAMMFLFGAQAPAVLAEGDEDYIEQALEDCRTRQDANEEKCDKIYQEALEETDGQKQDALMEEWQQCNIDTSKEYMNCTDDKNIAQAAKNKKFRDINKDVLAKMEKEQEAATQKYNTSMAKCMNKKKQQAMASCVEKAKRAFDKKTASINKKYVKKLVSVD